MIKLNIVVAFVRESLMLVVDAWSTVSETYHEISYLLIFKISQLSMSIFQDAPTSLVQKAVFAILMLISNAMVWRYFVKGLHSNDSSTLVPTVISTASNFIVSGFLGSLVFKEDVNMLWLIGAIMIFSGLYCIISEEEMLDETKKK